MSPSTVKEPSIVTSESNCAVATTAKVSAAVLPRILLPVTCREAAWVLPKVLVPRTCREAASVLPKVLLP